MSGRWLFNRMDVKHQYVIIFSKKVLQGLLIYIPGLINDPAETSDMAFKIHDTDGVYFIPAFSGLGVCFLFL